MTRGNPDVQNCIKSKKLIVDVLFRVVITKK